MRNNSYKLVTIGILNSDTMISHGIEIVYPLGWSKGHVDPHFFTWHVPTKKWRDLVFIVKKWIFLKKFGVTNSSFLKKEKEKNQYKIKKKTLSVTFYLEKTCPWKLSLGSRVRLLIGKVPSGSTPLSPENRYLLIRLR